MTETKLQFNKGHFTLYDSKSMPYQKNNHCAHFALTDALIEWAGINKQPVIHFWQTSPLAILGMMDTKIANFNEALVVFDKYEHEYMVRNSGGLAVVGDPGVLNVSLIYPAGDSRLAIDDAYQWMLTFVRQTFYPTFPDKDIKAFEISNSYCFGDYDLSIEGKKIAGVSQRRVKNGIAVMLYISVNGDQQKRAEMLKEFYEVGLDGSEPSGRYPDVHPDVMTTLEEAYDTGMSVPQVKKMMLKQFDYSGGFYTEALSAAYQKALEGMVKRNARVFGEDFIQE